MFLKRNAIIMAAGTSSRFIPLSAERPKGLLEVKGEILIERQIRQLLSAGISDITVVVGYKAEMFEYLKDKFGVSLVYNEDYARYNNSSSLFRVLDRLGDTYICSSDNYFQHNVFREFPQSSYYSAQYAMGITKEYCISLNSFDQINKVTVGGKDSWYMVGHVYFSKDFSERFKIIFADEYKKDQTKYEYWEDVYIRNIPLLPPMQIHRYGSDDIAEFDSLDELRDFDISYWVDSRSPIIKYIAKELKCPEADLSCFRNIKHPGDNLMFSFKKDKNLYLFNDLDNSITLL